MKGKQGAEGSCAIDVYHKNATTKLFQTFGTTKHFAPRYSEVYSDSKSYIDTQSEYVGNLSKMKFVEARVLDYDMIKTFIVPDLIDEYTLEVEDFLVNHADTAVNLFEHWSKISLQQKIMFQPESYYNCVND